MARVNVPVDQMANVIGQPAAGALKQNWTTGDATNGHKISYTGRESVTFKNTGASPRTFTIKAVADSKLGRAVDIGPYSVPAGESHVLPPLPLDGYLQSDGCLYVDVSHAEMLITAQKLQANVPL